MMAGSSVEGGTRGRRRRRNTIILAAVLAAVFLILYGFQRRALPDSGLEVVVQMDGEKIRGMDLDEDGKPKVWKLIWLME